MKRRSRVDTIWVALIVAAVAAVIPPLGAAVGFHSNPVGRHSHPAPAPQISLSKWEDNWNVRVGERNGYTISAYNNQQRRVGTVTSFIDTLPEGFTYLNGSTTGDITKDPVVQGRKLTWTGRFKVRPGSAFRFHFEVRVSDRPGWYANVVDPVVQNPFTGRGTGQTAWILVGQQTKLVASGALLEGGSPQLKLSARLTTLDGIPIAGEEIQFVAYPGLPFVGGGAYCYAPTNSDGVAECSGPEEMIGAILTLGYDAYYYPWYGPYAPSFDHADLIE